MMRNVFVAAAATAFLAHAGVAGAQVNKTAVQTAIVAKEKAINDAVQKGDMKAFHADIAADAISVDGMGVTKAADFDKMVADYKMAGFTITDSSFLWLDDTNVIHTYKFSGRNVTYKGQPVPPDSWASTSWANRGGKWVAVFHQESVVMPTEPMKK